MKTVTVALPQNSYTITIGAGLMRAAAAEAAHLANGEAAVVVSDETVWQLHGAALMAALEAAGLAPAVALVPPGEGSKNLAMLEKLYAAFAAAGLGRGGLVLAFGGGVVGDVAGFAAATWMRGTACLQLPTTLLAQVDSSVGGKTGIDLPAGKNLVGAFHQPAAVFADTALLASLPQRELGCGMAEVVKYGALFSPPFFDALAAVPTAGELPAVVATCCEMKAAVVAEDERDTGRRMLLNFGHSFGHAIEKLGGYSRFNHGEAVAMGMVLAARGGQMAGVTAAGTAGRLAAVLAAQGLPTACPWPAKQLAEGMALDKKARAGGLDLILLRKIGQAGATHYGFAELEALLERVDAE